MGQAKKDIKAKILRNEKVCGEYYKMTLDAGYIARKAKPGQFVQIKCSEGYEPLLRRPFSIHGLKAQGSRLKAIEILYEVVGQGTRILSKKKSGEVLDVLGPIGNGFALPSASSLEPRAIIIAGGIGVAPMVFLAQELRKRKIHTTVLLGTRTKNLILCEKEFKKLGCKVHIATDDGTKGCKGFVPVLLSSYHVPYPLSHIPVYACGPEPMLKCLSEMCEKENINCQVSLERKMACGIGACLGCAVKIKGQGTRDKGQEKTKKFQYKLTCKDGPIFNGKDIIWP